MKKLIIIFVLLGLTGCSAGLQMQGQKLIEQGKYDRAITILYDVIKAEPANFEAWRELGIAYYNKNDLAKAEDAFKQANNIQQGAETNLYLGLLYEKQEFYGKAIDAFRSSLNLKPKSRIKDMILAHLNPLIEKKLSYEISLALENEADLRVDDIPKNTIGVFDFDNTHLPPDLAPIGKGLAEFTASDLAKVKSLRVVDRQKIDLILKELELSASEYSDPSQSPRIGRLLGSRKIVSGALFGVGDDVIRLDGAVVSTDDESADYTGPTEGELAQIFQMQKEFVFKVIDNLGITLTAAERDSIQTIPTESFLAFMAYCRGLDFKSRGMMEDARREFRAAANADQNFGAAKNQAKSASVNTSGKEQGSFEKFEVSLTRELSEIGDNLSDFQSTALSNAGFIYGFGLIEQFINNPDFPPLPGPLSDKGTFIIRGNLDAQ